MKIHFASLGCARNLVDSEVMLGILLRAGYEATEELKEADFLIVNTCGFLEVARQESMDTIDLFVKEKKKSAKVVVVGCMVQKYGPGIEAVSDASEPLLGHIFEPCTRQRRPSRSFLSSQKGRWSTDSSQAASRKPQVSVTPYRAQQDAEHDFRTTRLRHT